MKRRQFLKATLVGTGGLWLGACPETPEASPPDAVDWAPAADYFPQSVVSGDPKPDSVVLWTRLFDAAAPAADLTLALQVGLDPEFAEVVELEGAKSLSMSAVVQADHCVKLRLTGLNPQTTYYYRFIYEGGERPCRTNIGRTKTAPLPDADVEVKFAFVTCQDRQEGQFFNSYRRLLEVHPEDLDFVLHLGDYIYEKATALGEDVDRPIVLTDTAGAILLNPDEEGARYAAKSLGNYRELYQQYRSDPALQAVHESYAFINLWDDHEFANDCWGINGTDTDGRVSEADEERRKNATQAWFEYQPVDFMTTDFQYDPSVPHPEDIRIYRDFEFGQHVHMVVTDLRSFRSDHPVPEDALPGAVAVEEAELLSIRGEIPADAGPYVDIETVQSGALKIALEGFANDGGYTTDRITGFLSASWVNGIVETLNEAGAGLPLIDESDVALPWGYAFHHLNKTSPYTSLGCRNLVAREPYETYCAARYAETDGASEVVFGATQKQWFTDTLQSSTKTFKLWANEFCLNHMGIDLISAEALPDAFRKRFYVICDDWTCFPTRKAEVIDLLASIGDVVVLSGDVHAALAATPFVAGDPTRRVVELVTTSISSASIKSELVRTANADPALKAANAPALAGIISQLMTDPVTKPSPQLAFNAVDSQGFSVVTVSKDALNTTMHLIDEDHVMTDLTDDPEVDAKWTTAAFRVDKGAPDLYHEVDGAWRRWDIAEARWMEV